MRVNIFYDRRCIIRFNNLFHEKFSISSIIKKFYDKITEIMLDVNSVLTFLSGNILYKYRCLLLQTCRDND